MKGQFIADLCVDGAEGIDISLTEVAFRKVFILPAVLGIEAELLAGTKARVAEPDVEAVFRGIVIGYKSRVRVVQSVGRCIEADGKILRQQIIQAEAEAIAIDLVGAVDGYGEYSLRV